MSKLKKSLAVVLAAALILSCSPLAFAASDLTFADGTPYTEGTGNGYVYDDDSFENPVYTIWADTSGTTRTWRLCAGGDNVLKYGNVLTRASKSGIPDNGWATASVKYYATAGEEIEDIKIVCRIYGVSAANQVSEVNLAQDGNYISNFSTTQGSTQVSTDPSNPWIQLEWVVNPGTNTTVSSGPNTNLRFVITFKYDNVTYTTYAYGHTEYIYRPVGCNHYYDSAGSANRQVRQSPVGLLYSAQARPEWAQPKYNDRGYANFKGFAAASNGELEGCGSGGTFVSAGFLTADNDYGTLVRGTTTGANADTGRNGRGDWTDYDGNRGVMTVWLDKTRDTLGDDTSTKNGLNMRLTLKNGEPANDDYMAVQGIRLLDSNTFSGVYTQTGNTTANTAVNGVYFQTSNVGVFPSVSFNGSGNNNTNNLSNIVSAYNNGSGADQGGIPGATTNLEDRDITTGKYILFKMMGNGPTSSWASTGTDGSTKLNLVNWTTHAGNTDESRLTTGNYSGSSGGSSSGHNYNHQAQALAYRFRVYDGQKLRDLIEKINNGTLGTTYQYGGQYGSNISSTQTANITSIARGKKFPQSFQFTAASWSNYLTAYHKASSILADFTCGLFNTGNNITKYTWTYTTYNNITAGHEQSNIDHAIADLIAAYNSLVPATAPKIKINHKVYKYNQTTPVTAADSVTYTGWDSNGHLTGAANPATPFVSGVKFSIYSLEELIGYESKGTSSLINATLRTSGNTTTIYNSNGTAVGTAGANGNPAEYTFEYQPKSRTLQVFPLNGNNIYTSGVGSNPALVTGQAPNFANIAAANGGVAHANFTGFYETGDATAWTVSGPAINTTTWTMPPTNSSDSTKLYEGWAARPVELHIVTSYGDDITVETQTPAMSVAESVEEVGGETVTTKYYDFQNISFSNITAPNPDPALHPNLTFVGFKLYDYTTNSVASYNGTEIPVNGSITASYSDDATIENLATEVNSLVPIYETPNSVVTTAVNNKVGVYAEYFDSSNQIYFNPNGGTMPSGFSSDNILEYTLGDPVDYPIPTREGYNFSGWVDENGNPIAAGTTPGVSAGAWTEVDPNSKTGVSAVDGGIIVMNSTTGFACYASWAPKDVMLTYRLDIPVDNVSRFNSPDSAENPYYVDTYDADGIMGADMFPANPRQFGKVFSYWTLDGRKFKAGDRIPKADSILHAVWGNANGIAYGDLTSYIKYAGEDKVADLQHGTSEIEAAPGDIVNIRFSVCGDFYTASSSFIFGYNKNFFEEITGVDVISVNRDNAYIDGIKADVTEIDATTYINSHPGFSIADYTYSQDEVANTQMVMILIDPNISQMDDVKTVSFRDEEYMIEIKLKIKDTAAQGSLGSVWLAVDQLRSNDNVMGDLYISFTEEPKEFNWAETERVKFDTDTLASTVRLAEEERPEYTLTAILPADKYNHTGTWGDTNKSESITITGPEGSEVLSYTFADNVTTMTGIAEPVKEGYTFDGFFEYDTTNQEFVTDGLEWVPGCYATAEQHNKTFAAKWTPVEITYTFYRSMDAFNQNSPYDIKTLYYDYDDPIVPRTVPNTAAAQFGGWVEYDNPLTAENAIQPTDPEFATPHVTQDKIFIAYTIPTPKYPYIATYKNGDTTSPVGTTMTNNNNRIQLTADLQAALGISLVYGNTLHVTEQSAIPAQPEEGHVYVSLEQIDAILRRAKVTEPLIDTIYPSPAYSLIDLTNLTITGGLTAQNSDRYEPVSAYLDTTVTTAKDYTVVLNTGTSSESTLLVEYQGTFKTDTYIPDTSAGLTAPGSWDNGTYDSSITVSGNTLTITGRYGQAYDTATLITAHLIEPFGYTFNGTWSGASVGTISGNTHRFVASGTNQNIFPVSITAHFYTDDAMTEMSSGGSLYNPTVNYNANLALSTANGLANGEYKKLGHNFAGWLPATLSGNDVVPITGRSAITGTSYDVDAAANLPEQTVYVKTLSGDAKEYHLYFIADYTPADFGVTYNVDGSVYDNTSQTGANAITFGDTYTVIAEPAARTGYTFDGWYGHGSDTKTPALSTQTMTTEGVTYDGTFEPNAYTVVFDANTGAYATGDGNVTVNYDAQITEPENLPAKAGYELIGWATTSGATVPEYATGSGSSYAALPVLNATNFASADFTAAAPVTLYAVWEANEVYYNVEFYYQNLNDDGYTLDSTKTISNDDNYKELVGNTASIAADDTNVVANTLTGFTFSASNANNVLSGTVPASGTLTLKVYYTRNAYTISTVADGVTTYVNADGTACADQSNPALVKYGADLSGLEAGITAPTKTGYYFTAWSWAPAQSATMPDSAVVLTAGFTKEQYTIHYNNNGATGNNPGDATVEFEQNYTLASDTGFRKNGYTFAGWYLGTASSCDFNTRVGGAGDTYVIPDLGTSNATTLAEVTLWAKWDKASYTVTLALDGGTYASAPAGYSYSAEDGYTKTVEFEALVGEPAQPAKTGYSFAGWTYNGNAVDFTNFTMPYYDITLTATWNANPYTITYMMDGGEFNPVPTGYVKNAQTGNYTYEAAYESAVAKPADPAKEGYSFTNWYTSDQIQDNTTLVDWTGYTMPLNGATMYAGWQINTYKVYFNLNDDAADPAQFTNPSDLVNGEYIEVTYGTAIPTPAATRGVGYGSATWKFYNDSAYTDEYTGTMPARILYAKAEWTAETFTVSFDPAGGTFAVDPTTAGYTLNNGVYEKELAYGAAIPAIGTVTKAGYNFGSWGAAVPATMPKADTAFTADWIVHHYPVTFNLNGATNVSVSNTTVAYNDSLALPAWNTDFTYTGWDFTAWTYNGNPITSPWSVPAQAADGDPIELVATFSQNTYSITYLNPDNTAAADPVTGLHYNDNIRSYNITPEKTGYDFGGWYSDSGLQNAYTFTTMPPDNLVVYAKWTLHEYDVVFEAPDDTTGATAPTAFTSIDTYGTIENITIDTVSLASADATGILSAATPYPEVQFYDFKGWSLNPAAAADDPGLITSENIGSWALTSQMAEELEGDVITFYPIYDRTPVTIELVSNDADIVDKDTTVSPAVGYIYNVGNRQRASKVQTEQLDVIGDGQLSIEPSKGQYAGTGAKVTVTDRLTNEVVEVYYIIVFGDVEGNAQCNTLDLDIIKRQVAKEANLRTWDFTTDATATVGSLTAEQQKLCECYVRAANADGSVENGVDTLTSTDYQLVENYVYRISDVAYDEENKHRYVVSA